MDASRLPPETPRRQLLKRIHRRSSILPSSHIPNQAASASSSSSTAQIRAVRRTSLIHEDAASTSKDSTEIITEDVEEDEDEQYPAHDENGEEAAWAEVEELMDTLQRKNQHILDLKKRNTELERELQLEKERSRLGGRDKPGEKGLTRAAAIKLEREFLSQEMILKGLQRDNEDKTIEVESLRRKMKIMSDFLAKQYGEDDWEAVVHANAGLPAVTSTKDTPTSPEKEFREPSAVARVLNGAMANINLSSPAHPNKSRFVTSLGADTSSNPFPPAVGASTAMLSPNKMQAAINNDDVLIPTMAAKLQTPLSSPIKLFTTGAGAGAGRSSLGTSEPTAADRSTDSDQVEDALGAADTEDGQTQSTVLQAQPSHPLLQQHSVQLNFDPQLLLASVESVRLLVQGFERKNALRRAELEATIDKAVEAERRAEKLKAEASHGAVDALHSATQTSIPA